MSYDRMGRRVTKNNQRFVYDGYLQIANFELQTSNIKLQTFIWDPTEKIATRPLVWNSSTLQPFNFSTSYYVHDGNKNVSDVVADNGDIAAHYEYAPFGAVIAQRGASAAANPWRFSSEHAEDDTATVYYNYRHYEPVMGRWMSRDNIHESHEQKDDEYFKMKTFYQDIEFEYGHCNNDLVDYVDYLGQKKAGKYWAKRQRRFQRLCDKIDNLNQQRQQYWKSFMGFINNLLDQTPQDPRAAFIEEGLSRCYEGRGLGKCPACCGIIGYFACDAECGAVPVVVNVFVTCGKCAEAMQKQYLIRERQFIKLAPMNVDKCE